MSANHFLFMLSRPQVYVEVAGVFNRGEAGMWRDQKV